MTLEEWDELNTKLEERALQKQIELAELKEQFAKNRRERKMINTIMVITVILQFLVLLLAIYRLVN